jgi:serine/threonine protein kinase
VGHSIPEEDAAEITCPACKQACRVADLFRPPLPAGAAPGMDLRGYELSEPLGEGGMGQVYRSRDPALGRELAIKVIHPKWRGNRHVQDRFKEEARVSGWLQHPAIVPVHNLGQLGDGRLFFTMKLVDGQTLEQLLCPQERRPGDPTPRASAHFG